MSYQDVVNECAKILKSCGRSSDSLKILAVSKLQPVEKMRELYSQGHRAFAENYVQEALEKQTACKDLGIEWHLIGSLQKNKVKLVIGKFSLIHAVESLKLATAISEAAEKNGLIQPVLLQVNIADEETKSGFAREELLRTWIELQALPGIAIEGLMTMPPLAEDAETVRPYFRALRELLLELKSRGDTRHPLRELSMGTSHDYRVAIEEGATIVRLGTILFGERTAKPRTQP